MVIFKTATIIIESDPYIYVTILRLHQVFRIGSGIWIGALSALTGAMGLACRAQIRRWQRNRNSESVERRSGTIEAFTGLSIFSALCNFALVIMHAYMMVLLYRAMGQQMGFYYHYYSVYVVVLFVLSVLLLVTGCFGTVAHIFGSIVSCCSDKIG